MRTRRRTGSYAVGRARRDAILDAAAARFAEAGYHRTPMGTIAEDVGLTERGLLHHFPTKKHLLLAVAERRFDFLLDWVAEVPATPDGLQPLRALLALTEHFLAQPGFIELFVLVTAEAADPSGPAHALYAERYERGLRAFVADFETGVASGALRPEVDYELVARRCMAMCDGLQLQWVLTGGSLDLLGALAGYLEELARTLLVSGETVTLRAADARPTSVPTGSA